MNTETIELEIVPSVDDAKLVKYAAETGLEKTSTATLVEAFRPLFLKSREAIAAANGVAESVKDATCVREIMRSRACRLALRAVRLESDEARKKHKQHALLYGRAVDGFHNILLADLSPVETALKEAEDIAERAEAKRLAELKAARESELVPLLDEPLLGNLADLSEADYMKKLSNAKMLRQAKLDAAAKAEAERLAKEEAARVERERLAVENARLQAEVEARESAYKAEREATRQAVEKKLAEERAEAARVAAEIKAKAEADVKVAADKAAQERAAALAKAKAESDRLAAIAAKERAEIEAKARRDAEEAAAARAQLAEKAKAEAAEVARVEAERKAAAVAAKKAAAAPDKAKVNLFAGTLRDMARVKLNDADLSDAIWTRVNELAEWCDGQAQSL